MSDMKMSEVLKLASELGIEYELDSRSPGFFVVDENGEEREFLLEEIMLIDGAENFDIDKTISTELSNSLGQRHDRQTLRLDIDRSYLQFPLYDGVA